MRFFFLVILLLSSRAANSGPLNLGDSTLSEPDDFSLVDGGGNTVDNGKVMELALDSSPSFQLDAFSNQEEANILPDPQIIPGIANDDAPNLLADLSAACSDSDRRVKGSAQNNGNLCPPNLETRPTRQSTEEDRQQKDPGINPNSGEKKEDGPFMNPIPPDDICAPRKKLYCCFGREIDNWNSREGCEECMLPFYIFTQDRQPMKNKSGDCLRDGGFRGLMGFADLITKLCPSYYFERLPYAGWFPVLLHGHSGCYRMFSLPFSPPHPTPPPAL